MVLGKGNVISGVVRLPEGEVAGEGGFPVKIAALYFKSPITDNESTNIPSYTDREVIIPEGENSIGYEITVYPEYSEYYIRYSLNTNSYVNTGYYSPTGTVAKLDKDNCAVNVTENIKDIDLSVMSGVKLSGKLMCPGGEEATEDLTGILTLYNNYYFADYKYVIEKGSNFTTFELNIPADLEDFILRYETAAPKYASMGFYNDDGTTIDNTKAQLLNAKDSSIENIQFYLWENKKISGEIRLPEDMESIGTPQKYEIEALVKAKYKPYNIVANAICTIEPFGRIASFELYVPEGYAEVILSCSLINDLPLVLDSYLGENGMVLDSENAKVINPGQPGSSDLELVPIKGERISGVITVDEEYQYVKYSGIINLAYVFDVAGYYSYGDVRVKWEDDTSDSQKFFINIPPRYMGEKFKIMLYPYNYYSDPFCLGENGVITLDPDKAKVFTYDGVDIENLEISFGKSPSALYGDVDNDGNINSIDLAKLRGYLLGMIGQDEINLKNSDVFVDGNVNSFDLAMLRKYLLRIIYKLPAVL